MPVSGANTANTGDACKQRHGRPAFKHPSFHLNAPGMYVELLHFETEVTNIFQMKIYQLTGGKECPYD